MIRQALVAGEGLKAEVGLWEVGERVGSQSYQPEHLVLALTQAWNEPIYPQKDTSLLGEE